MYTLKKYIEYLTLTGISFSFSYFLVYGNTPDFENNFNSVNLNVLEFFTGYQLSNLALLAIFLFLFDYDSESNYFLVTFSTFNFLLIIFLWIIKFTNLSRYFILISLIAFVASLFVYSRFLKPKIQSIYLTIDESIEIPNTISIKTDSKNFPTDLIEKIIYTLKNKNLTGIIINSQENSDVLYKQLLEVSNFFGIELFEFKYNKLKLIHKPSKLNLVVKNLEDLILSLLFLPVFSFVLIIFAVIVVIFDGFPIFYVQKRVGQNGKLFNIYKFRTMKVHNIDNEELEEMNERDKIVFKASNDPRITKLGAFLRKSSIDEVPQFLNILKNEMSFYWAEATNSCRSTSI